MLSGEESKSKKRKRNEFIDDEAELSGDDEVSEDELELSDDDEIDLELVDQDAPELDSDEEEEVRGLYHKQLENEDRRAVLLLQEQLEEKEVSIGQRRRRRFRWQTKELMENSLRRHYDPDDDDSQEGDDDDDYDDDDDPIGIGPRLRRPTEAIISRKFDVTTTNEVSASSAIINPHIVNEDSRSQTGPVSINKFLFRDKEIVEALSTRETITTRIAQEEKEKVIQRELKRVHAKSVFDQLYS